MWVKTVFISVARDIVENLITSSSSSTLELKTKVLMKISESLHHLVNLWLTTPLISFCLLLPLAPVTLPFWVWKSFFSTTRILNFSVIILQIFQMPHSEGSLHDTPSLLFCFSALWPFVGLSCHMYSCISCTINIYIITYVTQIQNQERRDCVCPVYDFRI